MKKIILLVISLAACFEVALIAVPKQKELPRRTADSMAKIIAQKGDWVRRKHDEQIQEQRDCSALLKKVPSAENLEILERHPEDFIPTPDSAELARILAAARASQGKDLQSLMRDDSGFDDEEQLQESEVNLVSNPVAQVANQEAPEVSWTWWSANVATLGALGYFSQ